MSLNAVESVETGRVRAVTDTIEKSIFGIF
jgi:hypothetical protein